MAFRLEMLSFVGWSCLMDGFSLYISQFLCILLCGTNDLLGTKRKTVNSCTFDLSSKPIANFTLEYHTSLAHCTPECHSSLAYCTIECHSSLAHWTIYCHTSLAHCTLYCHSDLAPKYILLSFHQ